MDDIYIILIVFGYTFAVLNLGIALGESNKKIKGMRDIYYGDNKFNSKKR